MTKSRSLCSGHFFNRGICLRVLAEPAEDLDEEEDVYMDAEQKQLPFSQQLPHLAGQKVALNLCGRTKVRRDPRRNWSNLDPRENRMNIPG